jgi:hypothetical protein
LTPVNFRGDYSIFSLSGTSVTVNTVAELAIISTAAYALGQSLESGWDENGPSAIQSGWLVLSAKLDLNSTLAKFISAKTKARDRGHAAVIGESMPRVMAYATAIGAEYWSIPDNYATRQANRIWINRVMDRNLAILDVGPSRHNDSYPDPSSENYLLELEEIAKRNYSKYFRLF